MLTVHSARRGRLIALVATSLALLGTALPTARAAAPIPPPTPQQMLGLKPKLDGIVYTTPDADKIATCKVEKVGGAKGGSGWVLKDADGKTLRLFFDTNGDNAVDVWSYYKDGVEVYREIDTAFKGRPDQYRWLNAGGSKWGVDEAREFKIKSWKVISPEEVSQEILAALITSDFPRYQALMISDAEMKALDLPAAEVSRLQAAQKQAKAKFEAAHAKLPTLTPKAVWQYLQTDMPHCLPADQIGSRYDLLLHERGTIVFTPEKGDVGMIQTGELIQVGTAWRVVGGPVAGAEAPAAEAKINTSGAVASTNPQVEKLIKEMTDLDAKVPQNVANGQSPALVQHYLKRADILEKIIGVCADNEREAFIRQLADSLSSAAQSSKSLADSSGLERIGNLEKQLVKSMPGSNLTAYVTYREMQSEYTLKLADPKNDFNKVQQEWLDRLTKFVGAYPKGEDTPDAILQAGQACEFPLNKDVEAKNWYLQLTKNYADKPQAIKATGAIRRLESEGQLFTLAGPTLNDAAVSFDVDKLRGKIVIVYYWASWNTQSVGDFAKLKLLLNAQGKNGVELVAVNLDAAAEEAKQFLANSPAPGVQLHQDGGLDCKLATDYGILSPPTFFLIGKDGKVVSHTVQINNLDDEVKKLVK